MLVFQIVTSCPLACRPEALDFHKFRKCRSKYTGSLLNVNSLLKRAKNLDKDEAYEQLSFIYNSLKAKYVKESKTIRKSP